MLRSSSGLGSMAWAHFSALHLFPAYKVSKAALNMLTVQYAQLLEKDDFTVVAITPGVNSYFSILFPTLARAD